MPEPARRWPRRLLVVAAYGIVTGSLLRAVGNDVQAIEQLLLAVSEALPELLTPQGGGAGIAIVTIATLASMLALGTFLSTRRTGTAFGLLTVGTLAVLTLPYTELPWAGALGAADPSPRAPSEVWVLATLLVLLATTEIALNARDELLDRLRTLGLRLPAEDHEGILSAANRRWLVLSLPLGVGTVVAVASLHPHAQALTGELDLLWVPALAGLVVGVALWWFARR